MIDSLLLLARAINNITGTNYYRPAYYLEFSGGKLDGRKMRVRGADIVDDCYHSYDADGEKTVVEKYTLSGKIYLGEDMPDGQKTVYYPFSYVSEEVSDCPLSAPRKSAWEY